MSAAVAETEEIEWPEIPENYFWRIRESESYVYSPFSKDRVPALFLVEIIKTQEKPESASIMDSDLVVSGVPGNWEREVKASTFPEYGEFKTPFNKEEIEKSARYLWSTYETEQQRRDRITEEARKRREVKEKFYGDYR